MAHCTERSGPLRLLRASLPGSRMLSLLWLPAPALAAPSKLRRATHDGVGTSTWVPVLVVVLVLVAIAGALIYRRFRASSSGTRRNVVQTTGGVTAEVTAEQLAGRPGAAATTATAAQTQRRPRRNRRTPSQMSTKSLPAYNKEPQEQELVVYRGPEETDDENVTTAQLTVVMASVPETDSPRGSADLGSPRPTYDRIQDSPIDEPLLLNENEHENENNDPDLSTAQLLPPTATSPVRPSLDTVPGTDDSHDLPDPRGDAPPYESSPPTAEVTNTTSLNTPPASPERSSNNAPRRSGFRTFFGRAQSAATPQSGHARGASNASADSQTSPAGGRASATTPENSQFRPTHRPSQSGGSSFLRSLSRMSSHNTLNQSHSASRLNLTSPSLISLNSISAPLPHTLTRTEIVYPRSGPTPDQIRLISSRESLGRFGVPYGAEAIAFAASTSRADLVPPPDFESVTRASTDNAGPSPLASHARTGSGASAASGSTTESLPVAESTDHSSPADASPPGIAEEPIPEESAPTTSTTSPDAGPSTASVTPVMPSVVPPSSFKPPPTEPLRAESRASSYVSYATALESVTPSTPTSASGVQLEPETPSPASSSSPPTPRIAARHFVEGTDATVRPTAANATASAAS